MSDRLKSDYDQVYDKREPFWKTVRRPTLIGKMSHKAGEKIVKSIILDLALPPGTSILDLGCRSGATLCIFRDLGFVRALSRLFPVCKRDGKTK